MAEIGLGYGSEFQLMRFLGHHRNYLNRIIQDSLKNEGVIEWLDFPVNENRCSGAFKMVYKENNIHNFTCYSNRRLWSYAYNRTIVTICSCTTMVHRW